MQTIKLSLIALLAIVGFVQPSLSQVNPKTKDQPKPIATKVATKYRIITIASGYTVANLYTTHSTNSPIIKTFRGGEKVEEIEIRGAMMRVKFGNQKGWIILR